MTLALSRACRLAVALSALGLAAGCSALSAVDAAATPLEVYTLRAPPPARVASRPAPLDLIVEVPTTVGALDTDRIMIRPSPLQAQYLPGVRWGDPVPVMVQGLILRGLEDTAAFRYVGREPLGLGGDVALVSEVTDFEAEATGDGATVTLRLTARLVRESDAEVVAGRTFLSTAEAGSTEAPALLLGFDAAAQDLVGQVTDWTLRALDGAELGPGT